MCKKIIGITLLFVLVLSMTTTSFAHHGSARSSSHHRNSKVSISNGCGQSCANYLFDEKGNFVSKDLFEQRLKEAVEAGTITATDHDYCLSLYDTCTTANHATHSGCLWR